MVGVNVHAAQRIWFACEEVPLNRYEIEPPIGSIDLRNLLYVIAPTRQFPQRNAYWQGAHQTNEPRREDRARYGL